MHLKRVLLTPTDTMNHGPDSNITVDLILSDDGVPIGQHETFGMRSGRVGNEALNVEPFVLFDDGSGDYGSGWEEERDFHFNLRGAGRAVVLGEYFTYTFGELNITYRVTEVVDLL